MGESILLSIKESVSKYAQVISTILKMDVDIVDDQMIRVAGTENFYKGINKPINDEGNAFRKVLKTRQILLVENPGQDEVCLSCSSRFSCREEYEICCPIILDDRVIGVISLALFDKTKKQDIIENRENYVLFLEQIAGLIAIKASEHKRFKEQEFFLQLMKKMIDFINEGVMVFDKSQQILYMNQKSEQILGNTFSQLLYLKKINEFAMHRVRSFKSLNKAEYITRIRSKKIEIIGDIYPIVVDDNEVGSIFVFKDVTVNNRNLLQDRSVKNFNFEHIIGFEDNFIKTKDSAKKLAYSDVSLLIFGETGTGKETFARAIHNESGRKDKPFVTVTCSGNAEPALGNELFGDGLSLSDGERQGKLQLAQGGTIFFDEIADLPLRLQGRLMNVIQNIKYYDIRLIASTSQDLKSRTETGEFRKDLYYSLVSFEITIPPVRSRAKDIPVLADYFLDRYCRMEGKKVTLSEDVIKLMKQYAWPGNVREIEKIVSFLVNSNTDGAILGVGDLPVNIKNQLEEYTGGQYNLERIEKSTILHVLNIFGNSTDSKKKAAKELGISVATLYRKLEKYGISESKHFN